METKLCKDCKFIAHPIIFYGCLGPSICAHPEAPIDMVSGGKNGTCEMMRGLRDSMGFEMHCGAGAKWFEQAPPPAPAGQWIPVTDPEPPEHLGSWESLFDSLWW